MILQFCSYLSLYANGPSETGYPGGEMVVSHNTLLAGSAGMYGKL